jgi:tetrahydromethanopterin S-methyltransferase subunit F
MSRAGLTSTQAGFLDWLGITMAGVEGMAAGLLGVVALIQVFFNLTMNWRVRMKRTMRMSRRMELTGGSPKLAMGRLCPRVIDFIANLVLVLILVLVLLYWRLLV